MFHKLKYFLLIPVIAIGISIFSGGAFADETSCEAKTICDWTESTGLCEHNDSPQPSPYSCTTFVDEVTCELYAGVGGADGCVWSGSACSGTPFNIPYPPGQGWATWCSLEDVPVIPTYMPTFQTGDVDALLTGLGTAMQGILDFFVSGATLWFTLAGALILIYIFRRALALKKVSTKINQVKSMKNLAKRQEGLRKLRGKY